MKTKTTIFAWQFLICLLPIVYLLSTWKGLPESVPMHYNMEGVVDRMGSKMEFLGLILFMLIISLATSLLIMNLSKIDPKQRLSGKNTLLHKIAWILVHFFSLLSFYIIYQTSNYSATNPAIFSGKYIVVLVCLLFVALGNLMNNIKQNYFVGIRTPWNLENEDNWRKTHHLGSKIWFFGGLLMALFALVLPESMSAYIIIIGIIPLVVIPFLYSYTLFKKTKNTF